RALRAEGLSVELLDEHRDVDTAADAWAVAACGAGPRFTAEIAAHLRVPTDVTAQRDPHRRPSEPVKSAHSAPPASEARTQRDPHRRRSGPVKSAHSAPPASEASTP
ncbi:MAG: hypothetical protein J2P20_06870, partial [Pseudonocardia sp.]|nr:hypothetical protein [Pseudonocardia sp.]